MKGKKIDKVVMVFGLLILSMLLVFLSCEGTITVYSNPCCPKIAGETESTKWICPERCPGGGVIVLSYTVTFSDNNNRLCDPANPEFVITNVNDNTVVRKFNPTTTQTGVYTGTETIKQQKDTVYRLTVTQGDKSCVDVSKEYKVNVVDEGDYQELTVHGHFDYPSKMTLSGFLDADPGVLIASVENLQNFKIAVTKDNKTDTLDPYNKPPSKALAKLEAGGTWKVGLTSATDVQSYNLLPDPQLTIRIYLMCDCP